MAKIDIGKVAFAGFGLVGRKPLAVVGWALFLFVVGVLPALAFIGPMIGNIADLVALAQSGAEPTHEQMMPMITTMYAANPILWLTGLITRVMITAAIFRAVLEPSASRWAYLRLGMGEVMMAVVVLVLAILVGVGAAVGAAVALAVCVAIWQASHAAAIGVGILLGLVLLGATIWVLLRLSLAAPMSLAEKNFRLFESWSLTRGNSLRLLLVGIILWVMLMVVEILVAAIAMAVVLPVVSAGSSSGALSQASIQAFFSQPAATWLPQIMPWVAVIGLVGSLIGAVLVTIITAPWAEAYRQLRQTPDALV